MKSAVFVDREQCKKIASVVAKLKFKPSFYEREFLGFNGDDETKSRVFLYSLAICHQTHNLKSNVLKKAGWDYLEFIYINFGKTNSLFLEPDYLITQNSSSLADQLGKVFSDTGLITDSTFDFREERAKMLIDIANVLVKKYDGSVMRLLNATGGLLKNKGRGLYELLSEMKAYSGDPVQKKASGFIKFLADSNVYQFKDWENYFPMMDYHAQRVLLRMGCVVICDKNLETKLKNKEKMESDEEVRNACVEATKLISKLSGKELSKMNDIFYPLGRSFCTTTTLCHDHVVDIARMNFDKVIDLPDYKKCPFESICMVSIDKEDLKYWQPVVETTNY
jgi:endonuclease III